MSTISAAAFADTKPHYDILDGLRGIAALTVVWFHIFEAFATSHLDQRINHGYLAVDFFFILSGFVIGYAYDDRWKKMTVTEFLKRRLIRLHPMVVIACLIPASPGTEIRGLGEMYPLNGPSWSLFFEYAGNILYAFFIRKLSTGALSVVVFLAGCGLAAFAVWGPLGDICVGFAMTEENMIGGSLRLMFAFSAGLLLSRVFKPVHIRGAFWICGLCVVALLSVPRIGGSENLWMNGLYDTFCAVVAFPLLVFLGASGKTTDKVTARVCKFLGDISYPLYMVHYPFIYLYYAWVKNGDLTFRESLPGALALFFGSVILAWLCLRLYDEPVRKFLSKHLLRKG